MPRRSLKELGTLRLDMCRNNLQPDGHKKLAHSTLGPFANNRHTVKLGVLILSMLTTG